MKKSVLLFLLVIYNYVLKWRLRFDRWKRTVAEYWLYFITSARRTIRTLITVPKIVYPTEGGLWEITTADSLVRDTALTYLRQRAEPSRLYDYDAFKQFMMHWHMESVTFYIYHCCPETFGDYKVAVDFSKDTMELKYLPASSSPDYVPVIRDFKDDIFLNTFSLDLTYLLDNYVEN
ncbi:hypothetical protein BNJ_00130 [Kaumoebavirus]|uniref:hypothetical protein n=1 Tax=Kaumoebavirus TaxID=1859492 RepID=UPI0009C3ADDE|nr:hypothetical protein BNJ_00130 [Kaumoebavirus]ARA71962.1 hypothetical protein BNJ_00130 [Kaumoebavirus]